jgi:hypothetical protein
MRPVAFTFAFLVAPAAALADPADDGYCDYAEGVADASAAPLLAPQLFGEFGYIEQPAFAVAPAGTSSNLRAIGGVRYSLSHVYSGYAQRARGHADCRRHRALLVVRGASASRALAARIKIYDDAQAEADKILADSEGDLEARRATTQDATATRLRVEELRALSADARRQLASLPPPTDRPLSTVLVEFQGADADMEEADGKIRKSQAYDLSVRGGVDRFLEGPNKGTQYFMVLELGVNIGALWLGHDNERAASGRARYVRSGHDPLGGVDQTVEQLRATIDLEAKRAEQTAALVADLDRQLAALAKVGGDDSKRYHQTVWFDWIKAKADLAFLQAHLSALREVIGAGAGGG